MSLQWRNQVLQSSEEGAGKRGLECDSVQHSSRHPSSKLCRNWLRHCLAHRISAHLPTEIAPISLALSPPSVQFVIVRVLRLPKKHIASNHDLEQQTRPSRVKRQFRLDSNNVGFICAA